jgi:hypothetical protein
MYKNESYVCRKITCVTPNYVEMLISATEGVGLVNTEHGM